MKKTIILQVIICLLFFTSMAHAISSFETRDFGAAPTNKDFIVIVDIMGIGSTGPSAYSDVCINGGTNVISGQTIALPQAIPSMQSSIETVKIGFNALVSMTPNTFVEFNSWIDCKGQVVFADIQLHGAMKQIGVRDMNGNIIELRFFVPGSTSLIRIFEAPGGAGIIALLTAAEGIQCVGAPYPNECFSAQIEFRSDESNGFAVEEAPASLKVQPNPFTTSFQSLLNLTQDSEVKVALFDLMGRELRSTTFTGTKGTNQFTVDGEDLSAGVYFLSVQTGDERLVERVVKK